MRKSVEECLYEHAKEEPDKPAVVTADGEIRYRDLYRLVRGYASHLKKRGMKKGDIAVVKSSQTAAYVVCYLGVHLAGGVVTSTEKNMPVEGILTVADAVRAKFVISDVEAGPEGVAWIDSKSTMQLAQEEPVDMEFPKEDETADILFTTGTTGSSKGVELSHKALAATAENLIFGCGYTKDTVIIVPGPLNHANPIRKLFTTIVNGSTIYLLDGMVNISGFYDALAYPHGKLACCLPPAAIRTIFALTGDEIQKYADRIDFIESATAPLPEPDKQRLGKLLPNTRLYNNYGSSEAASVCMYDYNACPDKKGCIGKPMPNARIIIVDEEKREIQSSRENMGYLACVGDVNMKGYVNEPGLTKTVLQNGIVYTNDIGYIDEDGYVYIAGRKDDVINVGGLKVAPAEVEEAALSIDGVDDCICVPFPHPITGQALKLLVVLREGREFSPREFAAELQKRLEGYKVPVRYEKVDHVARTYNGKLDRKAYRV